MNFTMWSLRAVLAQASKTAISVTVKLRVGNLVLHGGQNSLQRALWYLTSLILNTFLRLLYMFAFSRMHVRSVTDVLGVESEESIPVKFPFTSGMSSFYMVFLPIYLFTLITLDFYVIVSKEICYTLSVHGHLLHTEYNWKLLSLALKLYFLAIVGETNTS